MYKGDILEDGTIEWTFTTRALQTQLPTDFSDIPTVLIYKSGNSTPTSSGVILTKNYNSVTGLNNISIDTSAAFYETAKDYSVVMESGTVDSRSVVGETIANFSIENRSNISAANVNAQVDTALSDYDAPTKAQMDSAFTEIKGSTWSSLTDTLEGIRDNLGGDATAANQSTIITALGIIDNIVDAILIDTDTTIPAQITGLNNVSSTDVANAVKTLIVESEGNITVQQALSVILAVLAGQSTNDGLTFQTPNGNASRVAATVDANKNRTDITLTPSS